MPPLALCFWVFSAMKISERVHIVNERRIAKKGKAPALSGASGEESRGSKHGEGYENKKLLAYTQVSKFIINPSEFRSTRKITGSHRKIPQVKSLVSKDAPSV
jgi:hypothetical protein